MTTLTVWPSQSVPSTGITSASATLPSTLQPGATATFALSLGTTDLADATLSIDLGIEWSADGGASWSVLISEVWRGGVIDRHTAAPIPPQVQASANIANASLLAGRKARAYATPSRAVTCAATLTY